MEVHLVIHRQQELYGGQHNPRVYLKFEKGDGDLYVILGLVIEFDLRFFIYFQMPMGMGRRWLYLH